MKKAVLAKRVQRMEGQLEVQGHQIAALQALVAAAGAMMSGAHADAPGSARNDR